MGHTPDVFVFVREAGTERLLVALNFRDRRATLRERDHQLTGSAKLVLSTDPERGADVVALASLELRLTEGVIVRL